MVQVWELQHWTDIFYSSPQSSSLINLLDIMVLTMIKAETNHWKYVPSSYSLEPS